MDFMFFRKLNNPDLWKKIQQLRELIKLEKDFKTRKCWSCGKELNIYDFISDNIEFTPEYTLKLWQSNLLEFHCCECFKNLKSDELKKIEQQLEKRECSYCKHAINLFNYSKENLYLKITELKEIWLNKNSEMFCSNLCQLKYYKELKNASIKLE